LLVGTEGYAADHVIRNIWVKACSAGRKHAEGVDMVLHGQANLLELVLALRSSGCFSSGLDGREQQSHQNPDDRNHDQKFDQCEPALHKRRTTQMDSDDAPLHRIFHVLHCSWVQKP